MVEVVVEEAADRGAPLGMVQGRRGELPPPPPPPLCSAAPGPQRPAERRGTCRSGLRHPPVGKAQEETPRAKAVPPRNEPVFPAPQHTSDVAITCSHRRKRISQV